MCVYVLQEQLDIYVKRMKQHQHLTHVFLLLVSTVVVAHPMEIYHIACALLTLLDLIVNNP